jgi:hypothetical protein
MWWKLSALAVVTATLVFAVIPIRTHAVRYDHSNPPPRPSLASAIANMYVTPGAAVLIALLLAIATFVALRVIRGRW